MNTRINTQALKDSVDIVEVIGSRVMLKRQGKDYRGICPFHDDSRPSMDVVPAKQMFHCKSCGTGGDVIAFIEKFENVDFDEACKILGATPGPRITESEHNSRPRPPREQDRITCPPPPGAPPPPINGVAGSWCYRTPEGDPWFYVTRVNVTKDGQPVLKPNGKPEKQFYPWSWSEGDGWKQKHASAPRPLYGLERLAEAGPDDPVILVEGEKCCVAAQQLFPPDRVPMTWPGGAQGVGKVDFSPLRGRRVFIWPDADLAGTSCTAALCEALEGIASEVWIWRTDGVPEHFDVADALDTGWNYKRVKEWSREAPGGSPRLYQHVYAARVAPAAVLAPEPPAAPVLAPTPPPRRVSADIQATIESAKHVSWDNATWRHWLIINTEKNTPIKCTANACAPFRHAEEWRGVVGWDELAQTVRVLKPLPWGGPIPEQWADYLDTKATEWLDRCGMHYAPGQVAEAIRTVAHENSFHPVRDYLAALKWDGTPRLDTWLTQYVGAPDTKFTRFAGAKWMLSAVARVREPGCQVKYSLILIGPQDVGKSKVFNILGGRWYGTQVGKIEGESIKAREQASKLWIIESAELVSLKHGDPEAVKDFFSALTDHYRPAYGRHFLSIPRHCVFCGTSNRDEIFSDETGNVRFWPVNAPGPIDFAGLERDRDQLWAEAAYRQENGESIWEMDEEVKEQAQAEQKSRLLSDNWLPVMLEWLDMPERRARPWFKLAEIMQGALGVTTDRQNKVDQNRAAGLLRRAGWTVRNRGNGNVWVRPEGVSDPVEDRPAFDD